MVNKAYQLFTNRVPISYNNVSITLRISNNLEWRTRSKTFVERQAA